MITSIIEKVKSYKRSMKQGDWEEASGTCRKCGQKPEVYFLHDFKERQFLVIVGFSVKKIKTRLSRWKCDLCKKTFVLYPEFALPYKRYVCEDVVRLNEKYIETKSSYQACVNVGSIPISYEKASENGSYKSLEKSTLHRWIGSLGNLPRSYLQIVEILKQKIPKEDIIRDFHSVDSRKYQSERRREELELCQKMLKLDKKFQKILSKSIFPQFATRNWWDRE